MNIGEIKKKYNKLLRRYRNAERWIDDPERTKDEIDKHYGNFINIINGLNYYLGQLKKAGVDSSSKEILNGFEIKGDV
ncbi:hypothetical protein HNQ80_005199 [Anaerosolibacter carboniphilus]|uniref:Uncharacterized protein n=1 Tax=Anaerosolibacter carboniphilus TaxID=1417629 RepID=A0A841KZW0_9FIRM|nr:hypothetical protein [Anaerosolibacter carboniphilus]MBB6219021.1 hypothetical protein [Anaerosolibacter carboniphilus]